MTMDNLVGTSNELDHSQRAVSALQTDSWLSRLSGVVAKDSTNSSTDKSVQSLPTITIDTSWSGDNAGDKTKETEQRAYRPGEEEKKFSTGDILEQTKDHQRWRFNDQEITVYKGGRIDMHLDGAATVHTRKTGDKANPHTITEVFDSEGGVIEFDENGINRIERGEKRILIRPAFASTPNLPYVGDRIQAREMDLVDPATDANWQYGNSPRDREPYGNGRYGGNPIHGRGPDNYQDPYNRFKPNESYGVQIDRSYADRVCGLMPALEQNAEKRSALEMTQAIFKNDFAAVEKIVARYKDHPELMEAICNDVNSHLHNHSSYAVQVDFDKAKNCATVSVWSARFDYPIGPANHVFRTDSATRTNSTTGTDSATENKAYNRYQTYGDYYNRDYSGGTTVRRDFEDMPNPAGEKDPDKKSGLELAKAINKRDFGEVAHIVARYKDNPDRIDEVCKTAKKYIGDYSFWLWSSKDSNGKGVVAVWERRTPTDDKGQYHHFKTDSNTEIEMK